MSTRTVPLHGALVSSLFCVLAPFGCSREKAGSPADGQPASVPADLGQALRAQLDAPKRPEFVRQDDAGHHLWKSVRRFYKRRSDQPAWLSTDRGHREAAQLVDALAKSAEDGLDPADYDLGPAKALVQQVSSRNPFKSDQSNPRDAAMTELRLTYMFMKYATHLLVGQTDPRDLDPNWTGQPRHADLPDVLQIALSGRGVAPTLASLTPTHPQYGVLKRALPQYRAIAARGGWPVGLPADLSLKKGDRSPGVAALRARLQAGGDGGAASLVARVTSQTDVVDEALAQSVARFKQRHGLEANDVVDKDTVAALNVPVDQRVRQIELNLERWRWLPEQMGTRHVVVNIPTFKLQAFENGRSVLEMRVVTGEKDHATPIFYDQMTHLVFSPYWNIPPGIAREEWIPEAKKDPDYFRKYGMEIVKGETVVDPREVDWSDEELRIRQRPGAKNSLGLVKFAFPNRYNVYLHDTPYDNDFARIARAFSHGCVRVEKPLELAQWVLRGRKEWSRQRMQAAMGAGREEQVRIDPPVPVYLIYQTAWAAEDGGLIFAQDLYGHDSRQIDLIGGGPN